MSSKSSSESKACSGSKTGLVQVRLLTCCDKAGSRLCDRISNKGYCPDQVSLYRHKLTNVTMTVRNDRVLPGIAVFDTGKSNDSIRVQVTNSSRVSAWSKFFLDPSDSLVYFKMCRYLNRLKLGTTTTTTTSSSSSSLNAVEARQRRVIQKNKKKNDGHIVKFPTKRRSVSTSSHLLKHISDEASQCTMQSPMKRRRKSFDESTMMSVEKPSSKPETPMSVVKQNEIITTPTFCGVVDASKRRNLVAMSVEKESN